MIDLSKHYGGPVSAEHFKSTIVTVLSLPKLTREELLKEGRGGEGTGGRERGWENGGRKIEIGEG